MFMFRKSPGLPGAFFITGQLPKKPALTMG